MKPTKTQIQRMNKAVMSVARKLDRLELIGVRNNCPIRGVYFSNSPKTEYSKFRVRYRKV